MNKWTHDHGVTLLAEAFAFACERHGDQRRKGRQEQPYVTHLAEVARILARTTVGADPALVTAGVLHDVVEDTGTSRDELERLFGEEIAGLVMEVTDDQSLPTDERRERQVETAHDLSLRARMIRIADKISNMSDLAASPASEWPEEKVKAYFHWARRVVDNCRGINAKLEAEFDTAYGEGLVKVKHRTG